MRSLRLAIMMFMLTSISAPPATHAELHVGSEYEVCSKCNLLSLREFGTCIGLHTPHCKRTINYLSNHSHIRAIRCSPNNGYLYGFALGGVNQHGWVLSKGLCGNPCGFNQNQ